MTVINPELGVAEYFGWRSFSYPPSEGGGVSSFLSQDLLG